MPARFLTASLICALLAPWVNAASITFVPLGPTGGLRAGDLVALDVILDFSDVMDADGNVVGTLGGGFNIAYDSDAVAFLELDYVVVGDPAFGRPPDIFDGLLESWGAGDFSGIIGPVRAGTVTFAVLAAAPASTVIRITPTFSPNDGWVHAKDFSVIDVDYGDVTLTTVPLPPAALLLLTALLALPRPRG